MLSVVVLNVVVLSVVAPPGHIGAILKIIIKSVEIQFELNRTGNN